MFKILCNNWSSVRVSPRNCIFGDIRTYCPLFFVPNQRKFQILSIDDDPVVADFLTRASQTGFPDASVIPITSIEALTTYFSDASSVLPHLILLDLNIPDGESGFRLLKDLRNHSTIHIIPIIILSASDSNSNIRQAYFEGANAYMTKPETYEGWIRFVELLKSFWQQTATLPRL